MKSDDLEDLIEEMKLDKLIHLFVVPLKPSETLEILRSIGHKPQKTRQNFLIDGNIARKSLSMIEVSNQTPIVEIGPGLGTLTQFLLERGNAVYAVEIDKATRLLEIKDGILDQ